ncbi:GNAT family N-acetyltransferase [Bacillus sp. FJAT-27245]|uniref:GNAT family N-acetyltransferase n=1 Tax=Bacillus sp. FJAT-27245 TaxID=1684144 RepID=UPI0006A7AFE4|nr:GNAT family N-acetyltransferase [Bacillus sp. FJAT-27245]
MIKYEKGNLNLVQLDKGDIPGLIALSASVEWDYDEYEIATVMSSGKIFGYKNNKGEIVSSSAIIQYDKLASIGMVIVNKEYRGLGLGKNATQKCIESVPQNSLIMLIATEEGKPLYEKMGFKTADRVHKFLCDSYITPPKMLVLNNISIEDYNESDFSEVLNLDNAAFGDKRSNFLHYRINQSKQCLVAKDNKGHIYGYGLSILGPVNLLIGPIVASDPQIAALLLDRLAFQHSGKLRIDVPSGNKEFLFFLEQCGFKNVANPPVMMLNSVCLPARNKNLFGIAAQIFG